VVRGVAALGQACFREAAGFDSVWAGEHVVLPDPSVPASPIRPQEPALDPLLALAWAAARTTTVRLATGIVILPQRNPLVLAKQVASLDVLSGGRVSGRDIGRLTSVTEQALRLGLEVWLSPVLFNRSAPETIRYLAAARAAEPLRRQWPGRLVFVAGQEATLLMRGILPGATIQKRAAALFTDGGVSRHADALNAKRLLESPGHTVTSAMQHVGYTDPASFRRLFTARAGMTPAAYRDQFRVARRGS
jgi:hypothetical protein